MKAVALVDTKTMEVIDMPDPSGQTGVVVAIKAAGVRGLARHGAAVLTGYTSKNINLHPTELILSRNLLVWN